MEEEELEIEIAKLQAKLEEALSDDYAHYDDGDGTNMLTGVNNLLNPQRER